ncbi:winged helix-turn-helix transcriptional regulator [Hymenobacter perfusus]|uniref:Transcriptional regulator n=1 Tax=Hymenobacter perfusus TaxID=1236770 RepID=A0A3R9N1H1_9BACT|nr:helix-turn-helix domain-containing protein [Hymenobacter perfusus]RSK45845.1 transcriptional regulator [Hymenobacter perfusus]
MPKKEECIHYVRPVRDVLELLAGKWKVPLLVALAVRSRKFNELERLLEGITPRTLSKELKGLEVNELVQRIVCATTPVTVEYSLTAYGDTFEDVIATLRSWGLTHRARLLERTEPEQTTFMCGNLAE